MLAQAEDVRGRMDPFEVDELRDRLLAEAFDVERASRHEMTQPLEPLRRTDEPARTADVGLALPRNRLGAAQLAMGGEDERFARHVARQILDDLRNDVA